MASKNSCSECGNEEHYVLTSRRANRFGVTGEVVKAVECTNCGKTTSV
jgi:uncharacterized Zn finger protein